MRRLRDIAPLTLAHRAAQRRKEVFMRPAGWKKSGMRGTLAAILALLLGLAVAPAQARPLAVVTSFSILGDMIRQIGGDQVQVTALVGADGDVHVYQPAPADAEAVAHADVVIVNGLGLDGWLDRLARAAGSKAPLVVATRGIPPLEIHEEDQRTTKDDPHAWQDLANGRIYVANIAAALEAAAPERRALFAAKAQAYDRRLADLDAWVRAQLAPIPPAKRKIITSHDAFGYFGRAYGVTLLAPVGLATDAEPRPQDVAQLIRQIRTEHIRAVFLENMSDPRLIRQLAQEGGAAIGGTLYSDSLSPPDGPAPTYEALFRHNVPLLVAAMREN
jgi:zinc/manganese transport system substrate-binding protein